MNSTIMNMAKTTKKVAKKCGPTALKIFGICSMVGATVLAVMETPKAELALDMAKKKKAEETGDGKLTVIETVKAAGKNYIPAALLMLSGIGSIVGSDAIMAKRFQALVAANAITEEALLKLEKNVDETLTDDQKEKIFDKILEDEKVEKPSSMNPNIPEKCCLCKDDLTQLYFYSNKQKIDEAVNDLNRSMNEYNYISVADYINALSLETDNVSSIFEEMGWNLDKTGHIKVRYRSGLTKDNEPCLVIYQTFMPISGFDKFG